MTNFSVTKNPAPKTEQQRNEILENPGFGKFFTDHMVLIDWEKDKGFINPRVVPYAKLDMDPANMTLHYGQAIFEGLKAYKHEDGSIKTFRPQENAKRFARSAKRMAMPEMPSDLFIESIKQLISVDKNWVPQDREKSLYLRPFMFATEVGLGVRPANKYLFMLIASPAGAYFPRGLKPVSVWLSTEYVRAAPGGTGEAKFAGNYAASLIAQAKAAEEGCDQVVWLDANERRWIEEMGGMNLYFVYGKQNKIVTPELTGSLLAGITRDSILSLAKDLKLESKEEQFEMIKKYMPTYTDEVLKKLQDTIIERISYYGELKNIDTEFSFIKKVVDIVKEKLLWKEVGADKIKSHLENILSKIDKCSSLYP